MQKEQILIFVEKLNRNYLDQAKEAVEDLRKTSINESILQDLYKSRAEENLTKSKVLLKVIDFINS